MLDLTALAACAAITVTPLPVEVKIDNTHSVVALTRRHQSGLMFGAVHATPAIAIEGCSVSVGFTNMTMFVAGDLREGCEREHVFTHEQGHVDIYRKVMSFTTKTFTSTGAVASFIQDLLNTASTAHVEHDATVDMENLRACGGRLRRFANAIR